MVAEGQTFIEVECEKLGIQVYETLQKGLEEVVESTLQSGTQICGLELLTIEEKEVTGAISIIERLSIFGDR